MTRHTTGADHGAHGVSASIDVAMLRTAGVIPTI